MFAFFFCYLWQVVTQVLTKELRRVKNNRAQSGANRWPIDLQSIALPLSYSTKLLVIYFDKTHLQILKSHYVAKLISILLRKTAKKASSQPKTLKNIKDVGPTVLFAQ